MQHQKKPHPRSCRVCLGGWFAASRAQKSRSRIQKSIENVSPPLAGDPGQLGRTRWKQSHILVDYGGTAITREENFVFAEIPVQNQSQSRGGDGDFVTLCCRRSAARLKLNASTLLRLPVKIHPRMPTRLFRAALHCIMPGWSRLAEPELQVIAEREKEWCGCSKQSPKALREIDGGYPGCPIGCCSPWAPVERANWERARQPLGWREPGSPWGTGLSRVRFCMLPWEVGKDLIQSPSLPAETIPFVR